MSYILDALRKSEQQRQRGKAPSLDAQLIVPYAEKSSSLLLYVLLIAALIAIGLIVFFKPWQQDKTHEVVAANVDAPVQSQSQTKITYLPPVSHDKAPTNKLEQSTVRKPVATAENKPKEKIKPQENIKPQVEPAPAKTEAPALIAAHTDKDLPQEPVVNKPVSQVAEREAPPVAVAPEVIQPNENTHAHKIFELSDLPANIQQEIPKMAIAGYAYSNISKESSVGINDHLLQEGDYLMPGLRLEHINPDGLVFAYKSYHFRQGL